MIKRREILSFLYLWNNSVTIGLSFILVRTSTIILQKTVNIFIFFIWILFFNIFINITRVLNKRFLIIKMLYTCTFTLFKLLYTDL